MLTTNNTSLKLYNTLSRKKESIKLPTDNPIGLYVCGMTVYDHCHIGHARVWVIFDVLIRYLRHLGYTVHYVRNITDVDDKIIQRATEANESIQTLTDRMIHSMHEDMQALNLLSPTYEPRASEHIKNMIALIQTLIQSNHAYLSESGDVYYAINQFKTYGELAQQNLTELLAGARVPVTIHKQHPLDFVLWKKIEATDKVGWDSPWGWGRPGWHLECSAMALKYLGASFDIHGGGVDLIFPHHQNEIAQSEASTNQPFVKHWMHVGFVNINQDKMSKSLGNALPVKTLRQQYPSEVIRYFLLTSQYRSPLAYQQTHLQAAEASLDRLYKAAQQANEAITSSPPSVLTTYELAFHHALQDDLNTPVALSVLFNLARDINRLGEHNHAVHLAKLLKKLGGILGLLQQATLKQSEVANTAWIEEAIQQRQIARERKQWILADQIRQTLCEKGIVLNDRQQNTTWEYIKHND